MSLDILPHLLNIPNCIYLFPTFNVCFNPISKSLDPHILESLMPVVTTTAPVFFNPLALFTQAEVNIQLLVLLANFSFASS